MTWLDTRWLAAGLLLCGCVGDAPVTNPAVDAAPDTSTQPDAQADTGADAAKDAGSDAVADVQAPCTDAGAALLNGASGVQCEVDGGAMFCSKNISSCCLGGNPIAKCASKGTCGSLLEWPCDQPSDCNGQRCCLNTKGVANQQCGGTRVTDTTGAHCAASCNADEIPLCGGDPSNCLTGTCKAIQVTTAPYKRISGCL